jgi:long-chain acyl-CoA synthetase
VKTGDAGFFEKDGQLRIIDRAKDVGKLRRRAVCAEIHRERAEVLPQHQGSRGLRRRAGFAPPSSTSTCTAVGNWAERNNIAYASYQELAGHPEVYKIIAGHVDETNRPARLRADDGGRADQALPGAAQGARRRRRRD